MIIEDVTIVICNWMQTRFTLGAVRNVRKYYPDIRIIVVDDGSDENLKNDFNLAYARVTYSKDERFDNDPGKLLAETLNLGYYLVKTPKHVGHGSAIDYGLDNINTKLMLTMDNDIRMKEGGLIEEYLGRMNEDIDNIYAVGTSYDEHHPDANPKGVWIDPWFSLYQVEPIKLLHLSFTNFLYPSKPKTFHIGTGAFLHTMLSFSGLHRPKVWKAIFYPAPEDIKQLCHLKKFPDEKPGDRNYDDWHKYIDG